MLSINVEQLVLIGDISSIMDVRTGSLVFFYQPFQRPFAENRKMRIWPSLKTGQQFLDPFPGFQGTCRYEQIVFFASSRRHRPGNIRMPHHGHARWQSQTVLDQFLPRFLRDSKNVVHAVLQEIPPCRHRSRARPVDLTGAIPTGIGSKIKHLMAFEPRTEPDQSTIIRCQTKNHFGWFQKR